MSYPDSFCRCSAARMRAGILLTALVVAVVLFPARAWAWVETTVLADDVGVEVDRQGSAVVTHALTLRLRGSPSKSFDLAGVDLDAVPIGEATYVSVKEREGGDAAGKPAQDAAGEKGAKVETKREALASPAPLLASPMPTGALRLAAADGRPFAHGTYLLRFAYRTDLHKIGGLARDGATVRVRWLGPRFPNGVDNVRCTFGFAPAANEPRAASDHDADPASPSSLALSGAGAFLSSLDRSPGHDALTLMRPHVARGEQVAWLARVDPDALPDVTDTAVRPPPAAAVREVVRASASERRTFLLVACGLFVLFGSLTSLKNKQVAFHARAAGVVVPPLVPLPAVMRAWLAGLAVACGVGLELWLDSAVWGALVLVVAMALVAHRTPAPRQVARGPGRWLPLAADEAFAAEHRPQHAFLDLGGAAGRWVALGFALAAAAVATAAYRVAPYYGALATLDSLVLVVFFTTGRRAELPPDPARAPADALRRVSRVLRRARGGPKAVAWGRFAQGAEACDELRLLVVPKRPMRGLLGLEIGYAYAHGAGGAVALPEVLVRVAEDSEAEERARHLAPLGRWVAGRRGGARVLTIAPRAPDWRTTAALALRLGRVLSEPALKAAPAAAAAAAKRAGPKVRPPNPASARRGPPRTAPPAPAAGAC